MNITKVVWCTPYGHFFMPYGVLHVVTISCHMECFILLPSMSIVEEMERAPQDLFSMLYGVLHMALNYCHMEYSIWRYSGAVWSALELALQCRMKCSIWHLFEAIWSTPCGWYLTPYGVLHIIVINVFFERNTKSSIRLVYSVLWSTP